MKGRRAEAERRRNLGLAALHESGGNHYRVVYAHDGREHSPTAYFPDPVACASKRDEIVAENEMKIPADYYPRAARILQMEVWIERCSNGKWAQIGGSRRSCVCGVEYAD